MLIGINGGYFPAICRVCLWIVSSFSRKVSRFFANIILIIDLISYCNKTWFFQQTHWEREIYWLIDIISTHWFGSLNANNFRNEAAVQVFYAMMGFAIKNKINFISQFEYCLNATFCSCSVRSCVSFFTFIFSLNCFSSHFQVFLSSEARSPNSF